MDEEASYQNFLRTFINEGIILVDEPQVTSTPKEAPDDNEAINSNEETRGASENIIPVGNPDADILILLNQDCDSWIKPDNEDRFLKLLAAIKKDMSSIAIINIYLHSPDAVTSIVKEDKYQKIIAFGAGELIPNAEAQSFFTMFTSGSADCLLTPGLDDIFADKQEGLKLWNTLKQFFPEANNAK